MEKARIKIRVIGSDRATAIGNDMARLIAVGVSVTKEIVARLGDQTLALFSTAVTSSVYLIASGLLQSPPRSDAFARFTGRTKSYN